ncbi:MAG TPA: carboxymuconolactone decarboxylase family protein [Chitinophaga sp.]|uniref:carboxymuconolactone decarboxylase family protein n=1 Tax=Chitinophaga sp. TaxID=1869181 RepID=UPI002BE99C8C|nr:carboxymuconolactone decarboxylase family protein [Chitinophaga sp.]HVI49423.1 carboxymuconolactone decarboxylase family protein [Chitinophaga sp.]
MKTQFNVPTREEVSADNQVILDQLKGALGMVPNLYATIAYSDTALGNYLTLQSGKTSLSKKEKEVINLVVSQVNNCEYCLAAHTMLGKMNGLTEAQTIEIRKGDVAFDQKLGALVKLTKAVSENRGRIDDAVLNQFFKAGYTKGSLVDVVITIADKVVMNYLHNLTEVPVDFPAAPAL